MSNSSCWHLPPSCQIRSCQ